MVLLRLLSRSCSWTEWTKFLAPLWSLKGWQPKLLSLCLPRLTRKLLLPRADGRNEKSRLDGEIQLLSAFTDGSHSSLSVFPFAHGVPASGLQVRRLPRIGEFIDLMDDTFIGNSGDFDTRSTYRHCWRQTLPLCRSVVPAQRPTSSQTVASSLLHCADVLFQPKRCEQPDGNIITVGARMPPHRGNVATARFHWYKSQRILRHFSPEQHEV